MAYRDAKIDGNSGLAGTVVNCWYEGTTGRPDYATVAYAASTGAKLWVKRYDGPRTGRDGANAGRRARGKRPARHAVR